VTDRQEGERKPFDQVKEQIKTMLRNRQLQEAMQTKFDGLKQAANVKIDEAALAKITPPPAPTGAMPSMPLPSGH
jgi:parvulin-like peptidyl-prolyl isomerase